jgi:hypothetical protein
VKAILALPVAAVAFLAAGCNASNSEEGSLNTRLGDPPYGAGTTRQPGETLSQTGSTTGASPASEGALAAQGGTASVFPYNTPPTNRESITPPNYWVPKKENTYPVHEGEPAYGGDTQG